MPQGMAGSTSHFTPKAAAMDITARREHADRRRGTMAVETNRSDSIPQGGFGVTSARTTAADLHRTWSPTRFWSPVVDQVGTALALSWQQHGPALWIQAPSAWRWN